VYAVGAVIVAGLLFRTFRRPAVVA
jgi:hypothetical protein